MINIRININNRSEYDTAPEKGEHSLPASGLLGPVTVMKESFTQGSGHGGSHPHLAHEFAMALFEDRDPFPNAVQSANWSSVGLCAHQSALAGGKLVKLPLFTLGR